MLRVSLAQARPGMVLASSVLHPKRPGAVLLRAGVILDAVCIERLREIHPPELWIRYPSLDFLSTFFSPHIHSCASALSTHIASAFDRVTSRADPRLEFSSYRRAVSDLLDKLANEPRAGLFIRELVNADQPMLRHATNVCVLSVLMGLKLEFYLVRQRSRLSVASARDVSGLGVGAMLHDIGMLRLAPETLERWNATQDTSDPAWREHVTLGHQLVQGELEPAASGIVLHHHQQYDGSGFPARLDASGKAVTPAGADIHVFARIVAVADQFDRLRSQGLPTVRALNTIRQRAAQKLLDPVATAALLTVVPPYAPGTLVQLSNGQQCIVSSWNPLNPCAPKVVVSEDLDHPERFGQQDTQPAIDLSLHPELHIAEAEGSNVSQDNFSPSTPGEFDLLAMARRSENRADSLQQPEPISA